MTCSLVENLKGGQTITYILYPEEFPSSGLLQRVMLLKHKYKRKQLFISSVLTVMSYSLG